MISTDTQRLIDMLDLNLCDTVYMLVLADSIEEDGQIDLARTYRWAARGGYWPFKSHHRNVWDWDSKERGTHAVVPECSLLPHAVWQAIRALPDRKYGDIHTAFILLSRVIDHVECIPDDTRL